MPSAFSLAKKVNLLLRHRNCGSGGSRPLDKVGGGDSHPDPEIRGGGSQRIVFRPFGLQFGLKIMGGWGVGAAPRAPCLDPRAGSVTC